MRCPSCNHDNRAERRFCAECGVALVALCAGCGASNEPGEKFCGQCGASLIAAPPPSAAPPRPPELALATPNSAAAGERRHLTVLFCDLVGSTEISARLDPEEWRELARQYQRSAAEAVTRFGGHVAQYLGDGLVVYFGYPQAHENDAERAVRAGLAIVSCMAALNDRAGDNIAGGRPELSVRVGIHTGSVVVGEGDSKEAGVYGLTPNVAARLQAAADPDSVFISAAVHQLVPGLFVVEDRGPQALKGVREPVTLYRVVQPSGVRSRLNASAGRFTPFVGRETELARLVERWERVQDGVGQTVLIQSEAGVGKSRLVYQLRERLAAVPHTWLECGAAQYTESTPFHPVIALVSQGLAFTPEDSAAEKLAKLEGGLRAVASAENVALLAEFLDLRAPTPLAMSPDLKRRKTIESARGMESRAQ